MFKEVLTDSGIAMNKKLQVITGSSLVLIATAQLVAAQTIYKCEKDGQIEYSQQPCANDAERVTPYHAGSGGIAVLKQDKMVESSIAEPHEGEIPKTATAQLRDRANPNYQVHSSDDVLCGKKYNRHGELVMQFKECDEEEDESSDED